MRARKWMRDNWHDFFHLILLASQLAIASWIGYSAYVITSQNYEIQRSLYDFEPQISGFASDIWVRGFLNETVVDVEILIIAPHAGNFTLAISNVTYFEQYLTQSLQHWNEVRMIDSVVEVTYPHAYKYKASVELEITLFVRPELVLQQKPLKVGVLEFRMDYCDVPENTRYSTLLTGDIWFEFE